MSKHYQTKKRFGQHFLNDPSIIQQIILSIHPQADDRIVEIGPGLGALTFPLLEQLSQLDVVEIDRDVIQRLKQKNESKLNIHESDALRFDFSSLLDQPEQTLRVTGNLPYNISTPLIFHLLDYRQHITDMHFMLQKEVVDRLTAEPGSKTYGRLSVMTQYYCQTDYLLFVPPTAFSPPPRVDSAVIRLTPWETLPYQSNDIKRLSEIVFGAFSKRRKTLRNSLKNMLTVEQIESVGVDPSDRPERLSVESFVNLSNISFHNEPQT